MDFVNVTDTAKQAGFNCGISISQKLYDKIVRDDNKNFEFNNRLLILSRLKKRLENCRSHIPVGDLISFQYLNMEIWAIKNEKTWNIFLPEE